MLQGVWVLTNPFPHHPANVFAVRLSISCASTLPSCSARPAHSPYVAMGIPVSRACSAAFVVVSALGATWNRQPLTGVAEIIQPASREIFSTRRRSPPRPSMDIMGLPSLRERSSMVMRAGGNPLQRLLLRHVACHPSGGPILPLAAICARFASPCSSGGTMALSPATSVASMWLHQPTPAHEHTTCPFAGTRTTCQASSDMLRTRKLWVRPVGERLTPAGSCSC